MEKTLILTSLEMNQSNTNCIPT